MSSEVACCLASGTLAGTVAKVVEYPFDTIKVRVQVFPTRYHGYLDCTRSMYREGGIAPFYAGLLAPVLGAGAENAVGFTGFRVGLRLCGWLASQEYNADGALPLSVTAIAGAFSGMGTAVVLTPVELIKCRMQIQHALPPEKREYSSVIDCVRRVVKGGGARSLFTGFIPTVARESPGNAAWFASYTALVNCAIPPNGSKSDVELWKFACAGSCGGVMYWTAFFPADVVKTRMQTDPSLRGSSLLSGLSRVYRAEGVRGLYAGWGLTVCRAAPANAIIFTVYEVTMSWFKRRGFV